MPDYGIAPPIHESIKTLAMKAFKASQPADMKFGVVISTSPLQIQLNQRMILSDAYLILTNAVRDHSVDITVSWNTDLEKDHTHKNGNNGKPTGGLDDPQEGHKHTISGRKKITIHNGLTVGEEVLLLRVPGGEYYIVLDRVDEMVTTGEEL